MDDYLLNRLSSDRITSRQIDELTGLARGITADGSVNHAEAEFLQSWLAANIAAVQQPIIAILYDRIKSYLLDGVLDQEETVELLETLRSFTGDNIELGEVLKATSLPLCEPKPPLHFTDMRYCFTGTFTYGSRKDCEQAVQARGAVPGSLTSKTDFLVIGSYATESWKHSSFGTKIIKAIDFQDKGYPISIVSEAHWRAHL